ncbi:hypothetical protein [Phycicoccus sp. Soil803]|uniref:hypothetical protein n=1 Tax=Phycicoccus sp. Soil803 TaxID=1736415 RepID=UPI00070BCF44|nr:hypothetical protein [Phycicoccus sp. Soil803]KRF26090.1 hypothetical protein ASG95_17675 [Phycicoccus sp. Soil803]
MTRTAADRVAELLEVFTQRSLTRLRAEFTEEVVAQHDADPLWILQDGANRVLRILRSQPIQGKHLIYANGPDGPWSLGLVTHGVPGNLVLQPGTYQDYEDAMRAVFHERRAKYLEANAVPAETQRIGTGS